ncbi:hypothetical protein GCM10011309_16830 [Litorimonas cladophorae]|uniref:Peptidase M15A C-terminal domain-containing protein n=1 Tax=Litorimonas cladophorae TaxID=1220491 RepID=A0A918KMW2_9PROT|nr:D-Ala-D-Ala carboxypeptidase family metallohydrolase [Litorimonas cladophorae]GGX67789.1 hypothetical protein GCM10011309_16830 [Litorimonas cladophorae]
MKYFTRMICALGLSSACLVPSASFAQILLNGEEMPDSIWHYSVLPGETVNISAEATDLAYVDGQLIGENWVAPMTSGVHSLTIKNSEDMETAEITLFVLTPSSEISSKGYIGKYRIGKYPRNTPQGFIRLDKKDVSLPVSPNFKVGQFLCKQQPKVWPKYLLVSSDNLERLETLLEDLNEKRDTQADTLFVMSGYRTPFYNSAIGSAKFSRHMYGDAADVYVDTKPHNGTMDDLNRDGKITKADADFLYDYAQDLFDAEQLIEGGLGSYKANAVHGPFVHIDARGRPARWGRR